MTPSFVGLVGFGLATALCAQAPKPQDPAAPAEPAPAPRVALALLADRTRLSGGQTFELGVRFVMPPGWHIHWTNPGDGATRTDVDVTVPDGFVVEGPIYPGPERFDEPGGRVHYGYTGLIVVRYRVTAPKELVLDTHYTFSASARWLAHGEGSVVGESAKKLVLEAADAKHPSEPHEPKLFEQARARAPKPWSELADVRAEWALSKEGGTHLVLFRVERAERVEFFPALEGGFDFAGRVLAVDSEFAGATVKVRTRANVAQQDQRLRGLLRVDRGRTRAWYQVDLPR